MKFDKRTDIKVDVAFSMADVAETFILEAEKDYIQYGEFRHELKYHINQAKKHLRQVVAMRNKYLPEGNDDFANNSDMMKDLMERLVDQISKKYDTEN